MTVTKTYDEMYPTPWVKASDIPDGKNLILTVADVNYEPVGMDKEMKEILRFAETDKGLVVNVTNSRTLQQLFGADPNAPIGQRIALYATPVDFAGKVTMGIRINPKLPAQKPANGQPAEQVAQNAPPPPPEFDPAFDDTGL